MNKDLNYYCFVLGNNHSLCKTDVLNVLYREKVDFDLVESSQETLIINSKDDIDDIDIDLFGSVVKIVRIGKIIELEGFLKKDFEILFDNELLDFLKGENDEDITFGVSVYGSGCRFKDLNYAWYLTPMFSRTLKDELRNDEYKVAFMPLKERFLSTVSIDRNNILKNGFEIVLAIGKKEVYIGKTLAIQNYKSYSFRDYGRPSRDAKSGMIPPKLAKMMINSLRKEESESVLDPFCGSGTILEELILLGFKNITGSDISDKAINDSRDNINWLFENYEDQIEGEEYEIDLINSDVSRISKNVKRNSIGAIVSEPFLGSPQRMFNYKQIVSEVKKLEELYLETFREFKKILKKSGVVTIIFPVFRLKSNFFNLDILKEIKKMGFIRRSFVPKKYSDDKNLNILNLKITERNSIVYYRAGQSISREILLFEIRK